MGSKVLLVCNCLNLLVSQLWYFVHSSVSSQGIYRGIGAASFNHHCKFVQSRPFLIYWCLTQNHEKLKKLTKTNAVVRMCVTAVPVLGCVSLLCLLQYFFHEFWVLSPSSEMSLPLSRKQVACRQAHPTISFRTKEHLCTATYHYNKKENLRL
jgi:hypothetical protein